MAREELEQKGEKGCAPQAPPKAAPSPHPEPQDAKEARELGLEMPKIVRYVTSLEDEVQHYRARFTMERQGADDVLAVAVACIRDWAGKTAGRLAAPEAASLLADLKAFAAGTSAWPASWHGSTPISEPFGFATSRFDAGGRTVWALEMDKVDSGRNRRRWHTRIGLMGDAARVTVNIQVTYRVEAGCFVAPAAAPQSAPAVVGRLMEAEGTVCLMGALSLSDKPMRLSDYVGPALSHMLLDPARKMPIVLVATDEGGELPYCKEVDMARALCGMAQVVVLDFFNTRIANEVRDFFSKATAHSWDYRIEAGSLRIYLPGCDLAKPNNWTDNHLFYAHQMERNRDRRQAEGLLRILAQGIARAIGRREGDVLEVADVDWVRNAACTALTGKRMRAVSEKVRSLEARFAAAAADAGDPGDAGELAEKLEVQAEAAATWQQLAEDMESDMLALQEAERESRAAADEQAARASAAERKAQALEAALAERREASADCDPSQVLAAPIQTLEDILRYAEAVWPSRLVFTDDSWKGADEWNDEVGSIAEEYAIVKALAEVLYPLYDEGADGEITARFKELSGYELALKEGKMTKKDSKLTDLRICKWEGREYNADAHIKGRSPKVGFRLYHAWDAERRKIVVGHVGGHLKTYGTARKSINV